MDLRRYILLGQLSTNSKRFYERMNLVLDNMCMNLILEFHTSLKVKVLCCLRLWLSLLY